MYKVLQAIVDTLRIAAGSVELGSTGYSHINSERNMHRRTSTKPVFSRDLPAARAVRPEPQPFPSEPSLRVSGE
jgi:hypothetical protein